MYTINLIHMKKIAPDHFVWPDNPGRDHQGYRKNYKGIQLGRRPIPCRTLRAVRVLVRGGIRFPTEQGETKNKSKSKYPKIFSGFSPEQPSNRMAITLRRALRWSGPGLAARGAGVTARGWKSHPEVKFENAINGI